MYKKFDKTYFDLRSRSHNQKLRNAQYQLEKDRVKNFVKVGSLLDYGAGLGEFSAVLHSLDLNVYVYDPSSYAQEILGGKSMTLVKDVKSFEKNFFDAIILRGVLQHLTNPFEELLFLKDLLKPGGFIILLATPNCRSISFLLTGRNPSLSPLLSHLYPVDLNIIAFMKKNGFILRKKYYPYLRSPYSNLIRDLLYFLLSLLGKPKDFPFFRNSMELYFEKL